MTAPMTSREAPEEIEHWIELLAEGRANLSAYEMRDISVTLRLLSERCEELENHVKARDAQLFVAEQELKRAGVAQTPTPDFIRKGQALVDQVSAVVDRLGQGQAYSSTLAAMNAFRGALSSVSAQASGECGNCLARWRCFHCGEVFADEIEAKEHFGPDSEWQAGCVDPLTKDEKERRHDQVQMYDELDRERDANSHLTNRDYVLGCFERDLAKLFSGAKSVTQAYLVLDAMEGRALAAEERLAALSPVPSTDCAIDIPEGVYFSAEASNFYHVETKRGCGNDFYRIWKDHWRTFPQSEAAVSSKDQP